MLYKQLLSLLLLLPPLLFSSCGKNNNTPDCPDSHLPSITTSGNNTFGCRIDGENWSPYVKPSTYPDPLFSPALVVDYSEEYKFFNILVSRYTSEKCNDIGQVISWGIRHDSDLGITSSKLSFVDDKDGVGRYEIDIAIQNNQQSWHLLKNANSASSCAGYQPTVNIDTDNFVTQQNSTCPTGPIVNPDPPTTAVCDLMTTDGNTIGLLVDVSGVSTTYEHTSSYFHAAYTGLLSALDANESTQTARERFVDLASVSELDREQASVKCQKYVDIARILAVRSYDDGKNNHPDEKTLSSSNEEENTAEPSIIDDAALKLYPNSSTLKSVSIF